MASQQIKRINAKTNKPHPLLKPNKYVNFSHDDTLTLIPMYIDVPVK